MIRYKGSMSNFRVDAEPSVLIWARKSAGLSEAEAAKKIGVSTLDLQFWEVGAESPTIAQLRRMAKAYKRPLAVLYLSEPPPDFAALHDFRLLPDNQGKPWSPALREGIRRARFQQDVERELADLAGETPAAIDLVIGNDDDPEAAADQIRAWLGMSDGAQFEWESDYATFNHWEGMVGAKGILVMQIQGVELEEMRGCSISEYPFPAIVINGRDSVRGKTFTLLHELVHILLRAGGLCDLEETFEKRAKIESFLETFCNRVAAAVLMPRDQLLVDELVASANAQTQWTDVQITYLAGRFGVSAEAILRRLVTLQRASLDFYLCKRQAYLDAYVQWREEQQSAQRGGPSYYRLKLRNLGRRYVTDVLDAYQRRDINSSELSDFLDMKINNVPKLAELLRVDQ